MSSARVEPAARLRGSFEMLGFTLDVAFGGTAKVDNGMLGEGFWIRTYEKADGVAFGLLDCQDSDGLAFQHSREVDPSVGRADLISVVDREKGVVLRCRAEGLR